VSFARSLLAKRKDCMGDQPVVRENGVIAWGGDREVGC